MGQANVHQKVESTSQNVFHPEEKGCGDTARYNHPHGSPSFNAMHVVTKGPPFQHQRAAPIANHQTRGQQQVIQRQADIRKRTLARRHRNRERSTKNPEQNGHTRNITENKQTGERTENAPSEFILGLRQQLLALKKEPSLGIRASHTTKDRTSLLSVCFAPKIGPMSGPAWVSVFGCHRGAAKKLLRVKVPTEHFNL